MFLWVSEDTPSALWLFGHQKSCVQGRMWNTQTVWTAGHSVTGGERGGSIRNYGMTRVLWIESPTRCLPDVFMHKAGTRAVFAPHKNNPLCISP